jgi:outer membrane protein insertion porin family
MERMTRLALGTTGLLLAMLAWPAFLSAQVPTGKPIKNIQIQGNRVFSTEDILSQIQLRPGQPFSQISAQEDVKRMYKTGWFKTVSFDPQLQSDNTVRIIVSVQELPNRIQDIIYHGAEHLRDDDLAKTTNLKRGMPMSPIANRAAVQALLRKYHEMGRLNATVRLIEGDKEEDTRVVIDIVEGMPVKVREIKFSFFDKASGDVTVGRLREQLQSKSAFLTSMGGEYNATQIEFDVGRLQDYYRSVGFLENKISRELIWSEDHRTVTVVFHIEEGPRYRIGSVRVEGNKSFTEDQLLALTDLRPDAHYDKFVVQGDLRRLRDYHGYSGRMVGIQERVVADPEKPGVAHIAYQLEERAPTRVGEIIVEGNDRTRENVIRRQIPLYPGQILTYPDIIAAEQNLSRLGIFDEDPAQGVRPTVTVDNPDIDEPFKTVRVRVKEKPTGSFLLGVGVNSDAGLTGSIVLNERNFDIMNPPRGLEDILEGRAFRGGGQEFRAEAVPGTQFQRYTVSWRDPAILDSPYSLGISGYYYQRAFNEYSEDRLGGRITLGRRFSQYWSANLTTRLESVDIYSIPWYAPNAITKDQGRSFVAGFRGGLNRDDRDSPLRPTSGSVLDFGYEQVTGDYNFPIFTAEASKYWTTYQRIDGSGKHVLAVRSQFSYAGDNAPVYERFYGGGFRSMRGFAFRGVGPHTFDLNTGGNFSFLNTVEYQVPVMANDRLFVVGFVDSGTIDQEVSLKNYRVTAGGGLRISVPQFFGPVPIALDFGFPIVDQSGDRRQVFSFWLGFFN